MKIRNIIWLFIICICSACESWLDVNDSPNTPNEVAYQELLAPGISSVAYVMGGRYQVLGALWSQHWTQSPGASQYKGVDSYDINSSSFNRQFNELYSGALMNLEEVKLKARTDKQWKYAFIAEIMQVYTFQVLADLYNQIPFSQALKSEDGAIEPIWEEGKDIYDSLITRIDSALKYDFEAEDLEDPEVKDFIFSGDIDSWIQFANTLKLKIYLRQSKVNHSKAKAGIEKLYADEVEFLELDARMDQFQNESGSRNPIYETEMISFGNNPNLIMSRTIHSYLEEFGDYNRLDALFNTPSSGNSHKSLPQGDYNPSDEPSGISSSSYSKPAFYINTPVFLMSYMESLFLQAEAIIRYGVEDYEEAKEKYEEAITNSYAYLLNTSPEVIKGYAALFYNGDYQFPAIGSELEKYIEAITVQKWVALAGIQSLETFFEHNRTGYPAVSEYEADEENYEAGKFTVSVNNVTSGRLPKRLIFPETEYAANTKTPEKRDVWEPVWWDSDE